jgi:hypothetical protein
LWNVKSAAPDFFSIGILECARLVVAFGSAGLNTPHFGTKCQIYRRGKGLVSALAKAGSDDAKAVLAARAALIQKL